MALLNEEFSVDTLPQSTGGGDFSPIPAGWYLGKIVKADLTDNKAGTGQYIKMRIDVLGPTHQGRVLWANINIRNQSQKAEEIGRQQLGDIMRSIGLAKVTDTDQLIGGELSVKVEVKNDETYGAGNEIKAYKSASGESPAPTPVKPSGGGSPGGVKATPPWMKK